MKLLYRITAALILLFGNEEKSFGFYRKYVLKTKVL